MHAALACHVTLARGWVETAVVTCTTPTRPRSDEPGILAMAKNMAAVFCRHGREGKSRVMGLDYLSWAS